MDELEVLGCGRTGSRRWRWLVTLATATSWWAAAGAVTIAPPVLPPGTTGSSYSVSLTASGGVAPYTFTNEVGRLPNGLSLTPAGLLSGTPMPATVPFQIWATDADGREAVVGAGTNLITAPLALPTTALPPGMVKTPYDTTLPVSGGFPPYNCVISGGALPPGLTLSASCALAGTPQASGAFTFTVRVTDQNGNIASTVFTLNVVSDAIPTLSGYALGLLALLLAGVAALRSGTRGDPRRAGESDAT